MKSNRMSWLTLKANHKYRIAGSGYSYGCIQWPTGTGKSGLCIEDICFHLLNHGDKPLVINISCPKLKLTQQLANDLFLCLNNNSISLDSCSVFLCSSDNGINYSSDAIAELELPIYRFSEFAVKQRRVNIVLTCHKSLHKFISYFSSLKDWNQYDMYTYIDESHEMTVTPVNADGKIVEDERIDLDVLCTICGHVYSMSATPDQAIEDKLRSHETKKYRPMKQNNVLYMGGLEAIQKGLILPPFVRTMKCSSISDMEDMSYAVTALKAVMDDAKQLQPEIAHKVLVTCPSREYMDKCSQALKRKGYNVFGICSNESGDYDEYEYEDIRNFTAMVDAFQYDCFVFHVQMLISGIDIKTLTDCVFLDPVVGKTENLRNAIQTIGRVLRCLPNERGKKFVTEDYLSSSRKKKWGGVYAITTPDDYCRIEAALRTICTSYYGIGTVAFRKNVTPKSDIKPSEKFDTASRKVPKFIKEEAFNDRFDAMMISVVDECNAKLRILKKLGFKHSEQLYREIKKLIDNRIFSLSGEYNTVTWLTDTSINRTVYRQIPDLFKQYGWDRKLWFAVIEE